jgi:hypothetical protein
MSDNYLHITSPPYLRIDSKHVYVTRAFYIQEQQSLAKPPPFSMGNTSWKLGLIKREIVAVVERRLELLRHDRHSFGSHTSNL